MIGQMVSHYRILEKLGSGGMGVVYKAEDTKLGRVVALKVLPPECVADPNRKRRFIQEARAASALNHPNIVTIYDIDEADGVHFIAMEYVQGKTLDLLIGRRGLRLSEALKYAVQIAAALTKAHSTGIVHRDLKPTNVMVTDDGLVKVLDFGLAKLTEAAPTSEAETVATVQPTTEEGTVIGTVGYMSPEQAEGKPVDARSDIFSFGSVLYEVLTGQRAFQGETNASTIAAILRDEPKPLSQVAEGLPREVERVVKRCLRKDCAQRFQHMDDLKVALEELKAESDSGELVETGAVGAGVVPSQPKHSPGVPVNKWLVVAFAAVVLLLVGAFLAHRYWSAKAPSGAGKITQISHWNKPISTAALSPDGRTVAFVSPVEGIRQVFVMLASGGEPVQLTREPGDKSVSGFSRDGTEIYYGGMAGGTELWSWAVPTLGGRPRRVAPGINLVPSPDGGSFFYLKYLNRSVFRADTSGLNGEPVYTFENPPLWPLYLLPFPGGNDLLVGSVARAYSQDIQLHKVTVSTRSAVNLGTVPGFDIVWEEPGKTVLFSRTVNGLTNLWRYNLADRSLTQVTYGPGEDYCPMPDPAGRGIYYVNGRLSGHLTAYHVHSKESVEILPERSSQPVISRDGRRLMYIKLLGGDQSELWVSDLRGGNKIRLASAGVLWTGDWSPDSSRLLFLDETGGESRGYIVEADGRGLRQLGRVEGTIGAAIWSIDGKSLYLSTMIEPGSNGRPTVWKMNSDGSNVERFAEGCFAIDAAPDGRYLLGVGVRDEAGIHQIPIADRKCVPLITGVDTFLPHFAPDGNSFIYAVAGYGEVTFYRQAWRDGKVIGKPEVALKLPFAFPLAYGGNAYDFSRDLSTIVYARPGGQADLYLLSATH